MSRDHYMIAATGTLENGGYVVIPMVTFVRFEEGRYVTVQDAYNALFETNHDTPDDAPLNKLNPIGAMPFLRRISDQRIDVEATDLASMDRYSVEMTAEWARFYLYPRRRFAKIRGQLKGQSLLCADVPQRAADLTGGEVVIP